MMARSPTAFKPSRISPPARTEKEQQEKEAKEAKEAAKEAAKAEKEALKAKKSAGSGPDKSPIDGIREKLEEMGVPTWAPLAAAGAIAALVIAKLSSSGGAKKRRY